MILMFPGNEIKKELNALASLKLDLPPTARFQTGSQELESLHQQLTGVFGRPAAPLPFFSATICLCNHCSAPILLRYHIAPLPFAPLPQI